MQSNRIIGNDNAGLACILYRERHAVKDIQPVDEVWIKEEGG